MTRPAADLPFDPDGLTLTYQHHQYMGMDVFSETTERWTVTVRAPGVDLGDDDGPVVGELRLYRMRTDAGANWTMAADAASGDLLSIIEAVMEDGQFTEAFEEEIEAPYGELLVLDLVRLDRPLRGFGLGPILAAEAVNRLEVGCCAVAVMPGASEPLSGELTATDEDHDEVTRKIASLWEGIGFRAFADGVHLRDVALDHRDVLTRCRADLRALSKEYRAATKGEPVPALRP
jgi:hypothetical protein